MPLPAAQRKGKRQRFYARNALKTTLDRPPERPGYELGAWTFDAIVFGHLCRSLRFQSCPARIHPALTSFTDEYCGMPGALVAYVGALARLAIVANPAFAIRTSHEVACKNRHLRNSLRLADLGLDLPGPDLSPVGAAGCLQPSPDLLSAGNEPKLTELFARAELKRSGGGPDTSANSITDADNPVRRRALIRWAGPERRSTDLRRWFSCNFYTRRRIIVRQCGPIDLVARSRPPLK